MESPPSSVKVYSESWPMARPFAIAHGTRTHAEVVVVELEADGFLGRGESVPYPRYGESVEGVLASVRRVVDAILAGAGASAAGLSGAAANAVDCALWDLRCKQTGLPAHDLLGLAKPVALETAFTIPIDSPTEMQRRASEEADRPLLKVKTGPTRIVECVAAVRAGAPQAKLIVDANESWQSDALPELLRAMVELGVSLVEQPLPAGMDSCLGQIDHPLPIFADESFHRTADVQKCAALYDGVNIKLDKTGGLTEAINTINAAREAKLGILVGCMVGTSLAIAPAFLLAQQADWVDLDGPLLLAKDRPNGFRFDGSTILPSGTELWG